MMPVNFTQLFQDAWNFTRNQRHFTLVFVIAFSVLSLATNLLIEAVLPPISLSDSQQLDDTQQMIALVKQIEQSPFITINLVYQVLFLLISSWGILTVHHISQQSQYNFNQTLALAFGRFPGVLVLNILISLPLIVSMVQIIMAALNLAAPSIVTLFAVFFSIFIFIRLCLAPMSYLIGHKKLIESLSFVWQAGIKRTTTLFLYCLLVYFVFQIIINQLTMLSENIVIMVIASVAASYVNVFTLVISYRFYTIFTQRA